MIKTSIKIIGLLGISLFILSGCGDEKTTVTQVQKQKADNNIEAVQSVKIKTH
ncbi:MAG: hypothetical protein R3331_05635 [Sulfurospirillaceae bacterium]|nr:hypothetical protein [Sulfurospirillaceae bacterium]